MNINGLMKLVQAYKQYKETRPGKLWIKMSAEAIAEQKRHSAALDPLLRDCEVLEAKLKAVQAAIEAEQMQWRNAMVRFHPELKDYSFAIDDTNWVMRVDYREGDALLPGDSYGDQGEEEEQATPPEWVAELLKGIQAQS